MRLIFFAAPILALLASTASAALPSEPLPPPSVVAGEGEITEDDLRRLLANLELHLLLTQGLPWADQDPERAAVRRAASYLRNLLGE